MLIKQQSGNRIPRSRRRRLVRLFLVILVLGIILINAMAALTAYRLTTFADIDAKGPDPSKMPTKERIIFAVTGGAIPRSQNHTLPKFPYSKFTATTKDGISLAGWESSDAPETSTTVILCHGHGANKSGLLAEANVLRDLGYRVILFDFRAHGNSSGNRCTVGYLEAEDVRTIYQKVREDHPDDGIILYGISMGAVAAAHASVLDKLDLQAIILDMPYNRLIDAVRSRVRLMKIPSEPIALLVTFWGCVELDFWCFDKSTALDVSRLKCPILLQWGRTDTRVSQNEITAIQKAAKPGALTLKIYENVGHASLCSKHRDEWQASAFAFLKKVGN